MDIIIKKLAARGVPGLVLLVAVNLTGLAGAAALTTALAALGPGGMIGGVVLLLLISVAADGIATFGFEEIAKGVLRELYCNGESKETIKKKVNSMPISSRLKSVLYKVVDDFS